MEGEHNATAEGPNSGQALVDTFDRPLVSRGSRDVHAYIASRGPAERVIVMGHSVLRQETVTAMICSTTSLVRGSHSFETGSRLPEIKVNDKQLARSGKARTWDWLFIAEFHLSMVLS